MVTSGRFYVAGLGFVAAVVAAVFGSVGGFDFVRWDDDINITGNPLIPAPWSRETVGQMLSADQAMRFKPVYWAFAKLIYAVAGFTPGIWHWADSPCWLGDCSGRLI